jgi:hypothetical protein
MHTEFWWGKPDGKSPFEKCRYRRKDNIKMYIQVIGWRVVDWTDLTQGKDKWRALLKALMYL